MTPNPALSISTREGGSVDFRKSWVSGAQVVGDPATLGRVVRKLLESATRYAINCIELAVTETNGSVALTVDDDGPGIPTADRDGLFYRFIRLDKARDRDHGGAGLGLAMVEEIIEHHMVGCEAYGTDIVRSEGGS